MQPTIQTDTRATGNWKELKKAYSDNTIKVHRRYLVLYNNGIVDIQLGLVLVWAAQMQDWDDPKGYIRWIALINDGMDE